MRHLTTGAAVLLAAASAFAQKQTPPAPGTPRNFSVPAIQRMELPNGLRVRLVPYGEVPKVTVRLVNQTGNVDETAEQVWLADVTGTMMEQGTTTRTAADIARDAAMMGGGLKIDVSANQATIGMDVFSEAATRAIALVADVAMHPRFPEADLTRIKADYARQLSIQRSQQAFLASEKLASVMFPNHSYGRTFPTEAMLQSYTPEHVRAFYDANFGAARSTLYVVGRFDRAAVESAIRQHLAGWKAGTPPSKVELTPESRRALFLIDRPGAVQSTLYIGLPVANASHPDYLSLTVMNALLGGYFSSRITSNIREQKGYTYSPFSVAATWLGAGSWLEMADVTTNVTGPAIQEILNEIDRLRKDPPTETELRAVQNYLAGNFVLRNSERSGIANQLAFLDLYGLSEDYLRNYVQRVHALTPADIQRMAQTYIDPAKLMIVVVGDRAQVEGQLKAFGEITP